MEKSFCNVIWIDDEIENICPDIGAIGLKRELSKNNIKIIGKARSFSEFEGLMRVFRDRVDAVITDANFGKDTSVVERSDEFRGLISIIKYIEVCNEKREIPFYLYSGKQKYFEFKNGELDYFDKNNRSFEKGDFKKMFERIREDVVHINSPSYRIRKKYAKELAAASLIEENEESLFQALMYEYSDDWKNTQDYFTPQRKIVERIFNKCKDLGIIPKSVSQLNGFSLFLRNKYQYFKVKEDCEIMPKPLVHSLEYFLTITQDGSHGAGNLKLEVDSFVRQKQNINLFRTILYIAMDLCLWYAEVKDSDFRTNIQKWKIVEENFVAKGQVQLVEGKKVCGSYQLHYDCDLPIGSFILVKKTKNHDNNEVPFEYTNDTGEVINVIHYVYASDVVELF